MIEYKVILTKKADQGLYDIFQFIAQRNPVQAEIFTHELAETFKKTLSMFPNGINAKKIGTRTMRKFSWKGYSAYYDVNEAEKIVDILYILSDSQQAEKIIDPNG